MQNQSKEIVAKSVFISYSTDDSASAEQMRDGLEAASIACWMAPRDIAPGLEYGSQIVAAIEECSVLVLLLSESSNRSRFVLNEVERAVSKDKIVIPVRIHNVTPSRSLEFFISNAQWIDAWQGPLAAPLESLTAAILAHLAPITQPPAHPITPPSPLRHNLPSPITPFVGRERELADLDALIFEPRTRLTTILGSGGTGKSRLAIEVAHRQLAQSDGFPDGVFFVPLAPLRAAEHVAATIADAIGFVMDTARQTRSPEQQMHDYLRSKRLLLVLDNFEHLVSGAELVSDILQAAPEVHVLVTSRERLQVRDEQVYPIHGLPTPSGATPQEMAQHVAVQLFIDRARRVQPAFVLRSADLSSMVEICRTVGGVPLALELAAGWVDLMSISEIAAELRQSLDLLETEDRNVPDRQRSMRAAFDYSWQRLSQSEQTVLASLAVFRGGFDRQAAAQVAAASLRSLSALAAKSLLEVSAVGYRYNLHEVIRQYSAQALALTPDAEQEVRTRHSAYYAELLQQQEPKLMGPAQMAALHEIEVEHENIRAGWQWAIQQGLAENLDKAMESLCLFYEWRGRYQDGVEVCQASASSQSVQGESRVHARSLVWLATFLRMIGKRAEAHEQLRLGMNLVESNALSKQESDRQRAAMLMVMSALAYDEGQAHQAREYAEGSLALFAALHQSWHMAKVGLRLSDTIVYFSVSGDARARQTRLIEAKEVAQRSLGIYRELNDEIGIAESVSALGLIMHLSGSQDTALSLLQECIALYDRIGTHRGRSSANFHISIVYSALGDYENARHHAEVAVYLARDLGDPGPLGFALWELGRNETIIDHSSTRADPVLQESVAINRRSGQRGLMAIGLNYLAYADYSQNRKHEMHQHLLEALQTGYETHFHFPYVLSLPLVALLLTERGEYERALELYTQALAHLCNGCKHRWFEDVAGRHVAAAAATLPPAVVSAAQERAWQRNLWETTEELIAEIETWSS